MSGPALLVLIFSGGYLGGITGASKEGWVLASVLGIIVALGIGFALVMPRMKRIRQHCPTVMGRSPRRRWIRCRTASWSR